MTNLDIQETLYWYDQPILFTSMLEKKFQLVMLMDDDTFLAAETTPEIIQAIKDSKIFLRDAFTENKCSLVKCVTNSGWIIESVEPFEPTDEYLPGANLYLYL